MPAPRNIVLTPAQIAKQAERKAAKLAKKAAAVVNGPTISAAEAEKSRILLRKWAALPAALTVPGPQRVKIVTWNMLAQTLVRRDLFPGSDCLRWSDRKAMLQAELVTHADVDLICLQECDRLDDVKGATPDHAAVEAKGPGKLHGLVVLYRQARFRQLTTRTVMLDDEELTPEAETPVARRGISRQTRNIGLIVALQETAEEREKKGLIVVTTHLFWHPKFMYERTRQVIVLLRAVRRLQKENGLESWPVIFAGDLNTEPDESTYQMLVQPDAPLHPHLVDSFNASRLVHNNVVNVGTAEEATASLSGTSTPAPVVDDDKEDKEDELPDTDERSIANTRDPVPGDGIRTLDEMLALGRELLPSGARSAYGHSGGVADETFASRGGFPEGVMGAGGNEPAYTCFTPKFHLTLDYLFLLPSLSGPLPAFTGLFATPPTSALGNGLPRKGVSASDHLPVGCEIVW